jgi:hypothetical protein
MEALIITGYYALIVFLIVCLIGVLDYLISSFVKITRLNLFGHFIARSILSLNNFIKANSYNVQNMGYRRITTILFLGSLLNFIRRHF